MERLTPTRPIVTTRIFLILQGDDMSIFALAMYGIWDLDLSAVFNLSISYLPI